MDQAKKERLQKKGWVVGDVDEFLELNPAEMAIVEMKVALARASLLKGKNLVKLKFLLRLLQKQVNLVMLKWSMRMRVYRLS